MKKTVIIVLGLLMCAAAVTVIGQKKVLSPKQERREVREKRRAERIANYEQFMDSLVQSRNFQFNPQSMQRQPAGPLRQIMNPEFSLGIWDGTADICLPYIKGYVAPYYVTIINYTVSDLQGYTTEQTQEGWMVSFSTSLFSASTYHQSVVQSRAIYGHDFAVLLADFAFPRRPRTLLRRPFPAAHAAGSGPSVFRRAVIPGRSAPRPRPTRPPPGLRTRAVRSSSP